MRALGSLTRVDLRAYRFQGENSFLTSSGPPGRRADVGSVSDAQSGPVEVERDVEGGLEDRGGALLRGESDERVAVARPVE